MKFKNIIAALIIAIMAALLAPTGQAHAAPSKKVKRSPVALVQQIGTNNQFAVVLRNGHTWIVPRCKYEDSRNCWWDAGKRGNKRGKSFADLNGRVHYSTKNVKVYYN